MKPNSFSIAWRGEIGGGLKVISHARCIEFEYLPIFCGISRLRLIGGDELWRRKTVL
jgi:hypothetical protein